MRFTLELLLNKHTHTVHTTHARKVVCLLATLHSFMACSSRPALASTQLDFLDHSALYSVWPLSVSVSVSVSLSVSLSAPLSVVYVFPEHPDNSRANGEDQARRRSLQDATGIAGTDTDPLADPLAVPLAVAVAVADAVHRTCWPLSPLPPAGAVPAHAAA